MIIISGPYFADSMNKDSSILKHILNNNIQKVKTWIDPSDMLLYCFDDVNLNCISVKIAMNIIFLLYKTFKYYMNNLEIFIEQSIDIMLIFICNCLYYELDIFIIGL